MNYTAILQGMVSLIQEFQISSRDIRSIQAEQHEATVRMQYLKIKEHGHLNDFYKYLYKEFSNEPDVFTLLLSILYKSTFDEICLQVIMQFLTDGKMDLFKSIGIRHQIDYGIFTNTSAGQQYELRRKIHKIQLEQMERSIGINFPYIPWEERNDKRVVVITNQLLTTNHAPTRNVYEICCALMDMGMDVLLIAACEQTELGQLSQHWYNPQIMNFMECYNGNFQLDYYGHSIRGYQLYIHKESIEEMKSLLNDIYILKPQLVWYMGGTSLFADLLRNTTTVISMPFSDGFSISEAPIMVEYMNSGSEEIQKMERYLAASNQEHLHLYFEQIIRPSLNTYSRKAFNLPEDGFIITIVGNRLDHEITEEFIEILQSVLLIDNKIHLAIVGNKEKIIGIPSERVTYLGLQLDLMGVLPLMDLFLNPPRRGGGTGAYWSLYNSIPVVTFDHCDVANCVTKEFICENKDEMIHMVERYFRDSEYYDIMGHKAKAIIDEIERKNNLPMNIGKLFEQVKEHCAPLNL